MRIPTPSDSEVSIIKQEPVQQPEPSVPSTVGQVISSRALLPLATAVTIPASIVNSSPDNSIEYAYSSSSSGGTGFSPFGFGFSSSPLGFVTDSHKRHNHYQQQDVLRSNISQPKRDIAGVHEFQKTPCKVPANSKFQTFSERLLESPPPGFPTLTPAANLFKFGYTHQHMDFGRIIDHRLTNNSINGILNKDYARSNPTSTISSSPASATPTTR